MMQDELALPIISAADPHYILKWFACLKEIMIHPHLKEEEKFLWIWLATHSADNPPFSCSFSYEQIAVAVDKTPRLIHRSLFRLFIMGFLIADLPIWYGPLSEEMIKVERHIKLVLRPKSKIDLLKFKTEDLSIPTMKIEEKKEELTHNLSSFLQNEVIRSKKKKGSILKSQLWRYLKKYIKFIDDCQHCRIPAIEK